ncbi:hypothetical protein NDU88_005041 [Pleurodeles waltl]|uniref:Uncharacterized protein n=1 Tax=Pleurodeles waltl TaxID=8319 RepID=A0AAV7V6S1_PLEWA|nr:hypothetical protein NDU88_005041 [Pleurodeles waltl]
MIFLLCQALEGIDQEGRRGPHPQGAGPSLFTSSPPLVVSYLGKRRPGLAPRVGAGQGRSDPTSYPRLPVTVSGDSVPSARSWSLFSIVLVFPLVPRCASLPRSGLG